MAFLTTQMSKKTKNYFFALEVAKRPFGPAKEKSSRRVLRHHRDCDCGIPDAALEFHCGISVQHLKPGLLEDEAGLSLGMR